MKPNFFSTFFCQENGKNSATAKENSVFSKSTKTGFTVLKDMNFLCILSEKFRLYRYIFNTVKRVFVDLKKTLFFLAAALFFPFSCQKNLQKKVGPISVPLF